jgi:hypothetical protein
MDNIDAELGADSQERSPCTMPIRSGDFAGRNSKENQMNAKFEFRFGGGNVLPKEE